LRGKPKGGSKTTARALLCALLSAAALVAPAGGQAAEVRVYGAGKGLPSGWVTALAAVPDGKLWVGTGDAGVVLFDPATGTGKGYRAKDGLSSDRIYSVALFQGKVYAGTAEGISAFDGSSWSSIRKVENVTLRDVRLAASPDGKELWACSVYLAGGTVRFDGTSWKFMGGAGRGLFNDIVGFAFTGDAVLLASGAGAVYRYQSGDFTTLVEKLPAVNIFTVAYSGSVAFLGTNRGLYEYANGWRPVSLPATLGTVAVFSLTSQGETLFAGTSGGLAKLAGKQVEVLNAANGLPSSKVFAVAAGRGFVAAGTGGGLAVVTDW
jgi:hypothetical protein